MKQLRILIAAAILMLAASSLLAQNLERREMMRELGEQMRTYKMENVHPQMNEWKELIDSKLSNEDLEKLNELRAQHREFMDKKHEKMRKHKGMRDGQCMGQGKGIGQGQGKGMGRGKGRHAGRNMTESQKQEHREKMAEFREKRQDFRNEIKAIVDNNEELFGDIFEEAEDKFELWKEDLKNIAEEWKTEHKSELDGMKQNRKMRRHFDREFKAKYKNEFRQNYKPRILLWDGAPKGPKFHGRGFGQSSIKTYNSPNPFSESTTIYLILAETGDYDLTVMNSNGEEVAELHSGELSEGENSFIFDGSEHNPGVYFYKIKGEGCEKTGKMMLSR